MLSAEEQVTLNTYNKIASAWSFTRRDDFWQDQYGKFQKYLPSGKIIDLGCGSGRDSLWFLGNGYYYVGVDISKAMIKLASAKNPKALFLNQSFYDLNFPPQSFDGFWSACSLLHIPKTKIKLILQKIKALLKPGGVGFIAIKAGVGEKMVEWQQSGQKRHFVYYLQDEFAEILRGAGFKILEMSKRPPKDKNQQDTFLTFYVKLTY